MSPQLRSEPVRILLVDDDPADIRLTLEALKQSKVHIETEVARDGVEALAYLRARRAADLPDIVLLDLNMPRKDGREALAEIRADPALKHIPVAILTTSEAEEDILRSYQTGANCYVTKPVNLAELTRIVKAVEDFWFTVVRLPRGSGRQEEAP